MKGAFKAMFRKTICYLALGVIALFLFSPYQSVSAVDLPEASSIFYYYDESGILTAETKEIILKANNYYEQTDENPQIVVAIIETLEGETIENYSVELFEKWKIGNDTYDNGVLILFALIEREVRFEIGYGLEGALTDGKTGKILDNNLSYLSENQYDLGLQRIFLDTAAEVNAEYKYKNTELPTSGSNDSSLPFDQETWFGSYLNTGYLSITDFFYKLRSIKSHHILILAGCMVLAFFTTGGGGNSSSSNGSGRKSSGGGGRSGGGGFSRKF